MIHHKNNEQQTYITINNDCNKKQLHTNAQANHLFQKIGIGQRLAAALLPRLFGKNPRSHHKGATGRVQTGDQLLPVLCHCQLGKDLGFKAMLSLLSNF